MHVSLPHKLLCGAPFNNLFFGNRGRVMACCANKLHVLGEFPAQSIEEIWRGAKANELREAIAQGDFSKGCKVCHVLLENGNPSGAPMSAYSTEVELSDSFWPARLEFELTNTCNLECIMCTGEYSSSIRERREMKPPLYDPYGNDFMEQLKPFLKHIKQARFVGGEPFLIARYFDIWEYLAEENPMAQLYIQTNGTVLNARVRNLLERIHASISVSIDSLQPQTYSQIRVNGTLERTLENIRYFNDYCKQKKTQLSLSFCPMSMNWKEIPDIAQFANSLNATVFYNTVDYPAHLSLKNLPAEQLRDIITELNLKELPLNTDVERLNYETYRQQISELKSFEKKSNTRPIYPEHLSVTDFLNRMYTYINSRESLSSDDKVKLFELLKTNLERVMELAQKEGIEHFALKGFYSISEDVVFQHMPHVTDIDAAYRELKERVIATLK